MGNRRLYASEGFQEKEERIFCLNRRPGEREEADHRAAQAGQELFRLRGGIELALNLYRSWLPL